MRVSSTRIASRFIRHRLAVVASPGAQEHLVGLLGLFHAVFWLHWTAHWQTNGDPFYGNHLLFERLYKALVEDPGYVYIHAQDNVWGKRASSDWTFNAFFGNASMTLFYK